MSTCKTLLHDLYSMINTTEKISNRHAVALRIAEVIHLVELDTGPYGGYSDQENHKRKPYVVMISRPATMDGLIRVFSSTFIQIQIHSQFRDFHSYSKVYQSEQDAVAFLTFFAEREYDKALEVPTK